MWVERWAVWGTKGRMLDCRPERDSSLPVVTQ